MYEMEINCYFLAYLDSNVKQCTTKLLSQTALEKLLKKHKDIEA